MKFGVIGLGRFGYHVAETLAANGMEVLAIDRNEEIIASIRDKVTQAVRANIRDESSLRALGIEEMETVIVAIGKNFAQSILITALIKKHLEVPFVIARSDNKIHTEILKLAGADRIVSPEEERGIRLANNLSFPFVDLVNITDKFSITLLTAPSPFVNKTLSELNLRKTHKVACIGVKKGEEIILVDSNYIIVANDQLVLAGENKNLEALVRL